MRGTMETNRKNEAATPPELPRRLIAIGELAGLWSVPKSTLYNWVNQGHLPYVKLGRSLRFDVIQIEDVRRASTMDSAGKR
jgi:excisionase family DNA binding protein